MHKLTLLFLMGSLSPLLPGTLYWNQDGSGRLFTINTTTGAATDIGVSGATAGTVGLALSPTPGVLYGSAPLGLVNIQADGSGTTTVGNLAMEGMEYVASSNTLYATINGSFFTVNQVTGALLTTLAAPGTDVEGLAYGNNVIYGLAANDNLYAYDIGTNTWSLVGATGFNFDDAGLAYDPTRNVLYAVGAGDALYTINPGTGAATFVGALGVTAPFEGGLAFAVDEVPEPATISLIALGLGASFLLRRRVA